MAWGYGVFVKDKILGVSGLLRLSHLFVEYLDSLPSIEVNWYNSPPFFLIKKESKNQGSKKNINLIFAQPKFDRVISEASSELPGLSKAELQSERNFFECLQEIALQFMV